MISLEKLDYKDMYHSPLLNSKVKILWGRGWKTPPDPPTPPHHISDKNSPTGIGLKGIFKTPHNSKISISRKQMRNILKHVLLTRRFKGFLCYSLKEKSLYIKKNPTSSTIRSNCF